jgi:hypothetical protein
MDNGGEFCENEFEEFCKKCGITRQKILHSHLKRMELQKG